MFVIRSSLGTARSVSVKMNHKIVKRRKNKAAMKSQWLRMASVLQGVGEVTHTYLNCIKKSCGRGSTPDKVVDP